MPRRTRSSTVSDPLLDTDEAATVLDGHPNQLERDRATGKLGIPYIRIGRNVRYLLSDLQHWLIQHRVNPKHKKARINGRDES